MQSAAVFVIFSRITLEEKNTIHAVTCLLVFLVHIITKYEKWCRLMAQMKVQAVYIDSCILYFSSTV